MEGIRTFIALPTPLQIQQTIAGIQSLLKASQADVKWESQDKFHITLVFLGNVNQSKLELLATALHKSVQQFSSSSIIFESMGAFPHPHNPRIVWMGIRPNQIIQDLQAEIARVCAEFRFPKEERLFHPHITLGRVKGPQNLVRLTEAIKTITFEPIETHCSEVLLMKSELRPGGSIYTRMKSFPLHT
jgi:RNA 2',3'-cyclic 3'-phosphodiesterase